MATKREKAIVRMNEIAKPDLTTVERNNLYAEWKKTYDEDVFSMDWNGPSIVASHAAQLYDDKDDVRVLDVGAGTGLLGKELYNVGFRHIDGIDGSQHMLSEAKAKGVYRQLIHEEITDKPISIQSGVYDVIVSSGTFGMGHVPSCALTEIIRLAKTGNDYDSQNISSQSDWKMQHGCACLAALECIKYRGGYIVTVTGGDYLKNFMDDFGVEFENLVKNGRLKKLLSENVENFNNGEPGIIFIYQII